MALRFGADLPSVEEIPCWINRSLKDCDLENSPVIVAFWALSCPYCLEHLNAWQKWQQEGQQWNIKVVGVHSPRIKSDRKVETDVLAAKFGDRVPCAVDQDKALAKRFQIEGVWPHYFFFDAKGTLRSRAAGGRGWSLVEAALRRTLSLHPSHAVS